MNCCKVKRAFDKSFYFSTTPDAKSKNNNKSVFTQCQLSQICLYLDTSQWTFAFILNYTTSHCFFWNILAWLWQLYQLLLQQLLLSTYIVPHKLKHTHINTSQVSQPTCYFELEDLTTKKHTHINTHSHTFEQGLPEKAGASAAGQTLREFLCPSHPCGRGTAVGNTEHFAHAMDLSMDGSALEMEENCSKRGVLAKQCKFLSVQMYNVQQV